MNQITTEMTDQQQLEKGIGLFREGQIDEALAIFRPLAARHPESERVFTALGVALRKKKDFNAAVFAHRRALALAPGNKAVMGNLRNALNDGGREAEALELGEALLEREPGNVDYVRSHMKTLRGLRRNAEAVALGDAYEDAHGLDHQLRLERAMSHLYLENYEEGFRDYESRFYTSEINLREEVEERRWKGEPLEGRHVVIFKEQGFGDNVWFARFIPLLSRKCARITLLMPRPLFRLMQGLEGVDEVLPTEDGLPECDILMPMCSVPHAAGFRQGDPIPPSSRLTIPDDSRERGRRMAARFAKRFRIGMIWTGSLTFKANHLRAVTPEQFFPLGELPGVQLISLYKGKAIEDLKNCGSEGLIFDAGSHDRDFADAAGMIENLDLLITTDTGVVHVAASMGKPVWNLTKYDSFWVYGDGPDTRWYPSMKLYVQDRPGDWDGVFDRVRADLEHLLLARGTPA